MSIPQATGSAKRGEKGSNTSHQVDAAWIGDYRDAVALNILGMLTATSFASESERIECQRLIARRTEPGVQEALEAVLAHGRERELLLAIAERRMPHFEYPLVFLEEVRQHLGALRDLESRIRQHEHNEVVRVLYLGDQTRNELGAIPYYIHYLQLIEAAANGESAAFWQHNLAINPLPSAMEMKFALSRVKWFIEQGRQDGSTRDVSEALTAFFEECLLPLSQIPDTADLKIGPLLDTSLYGRLNSLPTSPQVSPEAVRAFFSSVLHDQGFTGWDTLIDYAALTTRLEPGLRQYVLAGGTPYSVNKVIELVAHEWLAHLSPRLVGERSRLGLLGIGTGKSLSIEEGVGLYYEWELAKQQGKRYDEARIWLGTLATGLAAGVLVTPQDFFALYTFFEQFLLLYRMVWRADEDLSVAQERARALARNRCLRTYRAVPIASQTGICFSKDAHYARGFFQVFQAVGRDAAVLDWLASGVIALEQIPNLQVLGMSPAVHSPKALLERPDLEEYILSFETGERQ